MASSRPSLAPAAGYSGTPLAKKLGLDERLRRSLRDDVVLWASWPKKAARIATDIDENVVRALALPLGWVDVEVCAVDAVRSGLELVVRRELRA